MRQTYHLSDRTLPEDVSEELLTSLAEGHDHVLYIEIGQVDRRMVVFGPIDGDQP